MRKSIVASSIAVGLALCSPAAAQEMPKPWETLRTLVPLPPEEGAEPLGAPESALPPAAEEHPAAAPPAACWRHGAGRWRRMPSEMDLNACVQTLFAGRCERPGGATYGRWGQQTLRLVAGRVEISDDNQSFRTLAPQGPGCSLPPVG